MSSEILHNAHWTEESNCGYTTHHIPGVDVDVDVDVDVLGSLPMSVKGTLD